MHRSMICLFSAAVLLSGCASPFDPMQRPGNWSETNAANETIAQQAANPADLIAGHGTGTSNGIAASAAIDLALGSNGAGTAKGLQTPAVVIQASSGN